MSKHTPGKWTADGGNTVVSADSDKLNSGYGICETGGPDQNANAIFISAAPLMLEALQAARDLWGDYLPPGNSNAMSAMKLVGAAIAKAKGVKP